MLGLQAWRQPALSTVLSSFRTTSALQVRAFSASSAILEEAASERPKQRIPQNLKDTLPPKKPTTPYVRFFVEQMKIAVADKSPENPWTRAKTSAVAKAAGEAWKNLTLTERAKYATPASEIAEYEKQVAEWTKELDPSKLKAINKIRKFNGLPKIKAKGDAVAPPATAFSFFIKEFTVKHAASDLAPEEKGGVATIRRAADTWRSLSDSEKKPYFDRLNAARAEYQARYPKGEAPPPPSRKKTKKTATKKAKKAEDSDD